MYLFHLKYRTSDLFIGAMSEEDLYEFLMIQYSGITLSEVHIISSIEIVVPMTKPHPFIWKSIMDEGAVDAQRGARELSDYRIGQLKTGLKNRVSNNWFAAFQGNSQANAYKWEAYKEIADAFNREIEMHPPYDIDYYINQHTSQRELIDALMERFVRRGTNMQRHDEKFIVNTVSKFYK